MWSAFTMGSDNVYFVNGRWDAVDPTIVRGLGKSQIGRLLQATDRRRCQWSWPP
jgi:hypothetical protein